MTKDQVLFCIPASVFLLAAYLLKWSPQRKESLMLSYPKEMDKLLCSCWNACNTCKAH